MAEGVKSASGAVTDPGTQGKPGNSVPPEPEPDPDAAPRGWRWDAPARKWVPKLSPGRKKSAADPQDPPAAGAGSGPAGDPEPAWMRSAAADSGKATGKLDYDAVPQDVKDDIAGLAGLIGIPILSMLQQADPYCGGALAASYEPVVDAALPLICRSKKIVAYFTGDKADWLLWGKLAMALRPVGQAILEHHVFRTVEVVRDEHGRPVARPRRQPEHADHLTPPGPDFSYAA